MGTQQFDTQTQVGQPNGRATVTDDRGLLVNDGTNDRVLAGYLKDGFGTGVNYGFKVSQSGYDVKTATDDHIIMSSAYNMFKIVATGTITIAQFTIAGASSRGTTVVGSYAHNLGYLPVAFAFMTTDQAGLDSSYNLWPAYEFTWWAGNQFVAQSSGGAANLQAVTMAGYMKRTMSVDTSGLWFYTEGRNVSGATNTYGPYYIKYYLMRETYTS